VTKAGVLARLNGRAWADQETHRIKASFKCTLIDRGTCEHTSTAHGCTRSAAGNA